MGRREIGRNLGLYRSESAGVSNEKMGENHIRRKSEVSMGRCVRPG